jgi:hypothetical protein
MTGSGIVVAVRPTEVIVASRGGQITIDRTVDATAYQIGDQVRIVGGVVVGKRRTASKIVRV